MKNKTFNIHLDYTMFNLLSMLKTQLHTICAYMQEHTPYGDEYLAAFKQYKKVDSEIAKLESALQVALELGGKK